MKHHMIYDKTCDFDKTNYHELGTCRTTETHKSSTKNLSEFHIPSSKSFRELQKNNFQG